MIYTIYTTHTVTTINADDYQDKAPAPGYYRIPANIIRSRAGLYTGETITPGSDGTVHYHAPTRKACDEVHLQELLSQLCQHFIGVEYDTFTDNPDHYAGLPFWSLLHWGTALFLYPPTAIGNLVADFNNVASDGEDIRFIDDMNSEDFPNIAKSFAGMRQIVNDAHAISGTFYYSTVPPRLFPVVSS